jgi:hypothetical protein
MRTIILGAIIATAAVGCGKPAPVEGPTFDERLSKSIAQAMCSDHAATRASALSDIADAAHDGDSIDQRVFDEASDLADEGCPQWAKAPDKSVQLAEKVVAEQVAKHKAAQSVSTKNATTTATSAADTAAE